MFRIVSLKTKACLLYVKVRKTFSQSNNSMAPLIRSAFNGWILQRQFDGDNSDAPTDERWNAILS